MLSLTKSGSLSGGVFGQYRLAWKTSPLVGSTECFLNTWVGGCCGYNMLSDMWPMCVCLEQHQFDLFMAELKAIFKERDNTRLTKYFDSNGIARPSYPISQVFFFYGDTQEQRHTYSKLITIGKEVHRYVSGSEPGHDTVMISIDL